MIPVALQESYVAKCVGLLKEWHMRAFERNYLEAATEMSDPGIDAGDVDRAQELFSERLDRKVSEVNLAWLTKCPAAQYEQSLRACARRFLEADVSHAPLVSRASSPDDFVTSVQQFGQPDAFQFGLEEEAGRESRAENLASPKAASVEVKPLGSQEEGNPVPAVGSQDSTPCRDEDPLVGGMPELVVSEGDLFEGEVQSEPDDVMEESQLELHLMPEAGIPPASQEKVVQPELHYVPEAGNLHASREKVASRELHSVPKASNLPSSGEDPNPRRVVVPRESGKMRVSVSQTSKKASTEQPASSGQNTQRVVLEAFEVDQSSGVRVRRIPPLDQSLTIILKNDWGGNDVIRERRAFDRDRTAECQALWSAPMDESHMRSVASALREFVEKVPGHRLVSAPVKEITDRLSAWLDQGRREGWFSSFPSQIASRSGSVEGVLGLFTFLVARLIALSGHNSSAARDVAASVWGDGRFRQWATVACAGSAPEPGALAVDRSVVRGAPSEHVEAWWHCVQEIFGGSRRREQVSGGANLLITAPLLAERPDKQAPVLPLGLFDIASPFVPNYILGFGRGVFHHRVSSLCGRFWGVCSGLSRGQ
jgi:hypothetical protein